MFEETETQSKPTKSVTELTYKDVQELLPFVTGTGKILPRRITKLTAKEQRRVTKTIKRARNLLLMR